MTDTTGETRTGTKSVYVGYTALQANVDRRRWQTAGKDVKVDVTTTTLDGEGQAAKGTLKVYRLKQPEKVQRPDMLDAARLRGPRPATAADRRAEARPGQPADAGSSATWSSTTRLRHRRRTARRN